MTDISEDQLWARLKDEGVHVKVLTELADQNMLSVSGLVDTCRNSHLTSAQKLSIEVGLLDAFPLRVLSALHRHSMALNAQQTTATTSANASYINSQPHPHPQLSREQKMLLETAGRIWHNHSL